MYSALCVTVSMTVNPVKSMSDSRYQVSENYASDDNEYVY